MLEHLDRHHAVEYALGLEIVGVGSDHAEIVQSPRRDFAFDKTPLGVGIGDGHDVAARELARHPQRERAPAAAKLENALSIVQPRMRRGLGKGEFFSLGKRGAVASIEAAGIFAGLPKHEAEEVGRHLVMLSVCRVGMHGNGPIAHRACEICRSAGRLSGKRAWRAANQCLNRPFRHLIRQRHPLEGTYRRRRQSHGYPASLDGRGKKADVLA
jgi:hypothetical protein